MSDRFRMRCESVEYRQGFIEVMRVHSGLVNLETWNYSSDISGLECRGEGLPEHCGNTELELTPAEARSLAAALLDATDAVKRRPEVP